MMYQLLLIIVEPAARPEFYEMTGSGLSAKGYVCRCVHPTFRQFVGNRANVSRSRQNVVDHDLPRTLYLLIVPQFAL